MLNLTSPEGISVPGTENRGVNMNSRNVSSAGILQTLSGDLQQQMTLVSMLLDEFKKLRKDMPLSHTICFLMVAQEEGLTVSQYAERANVGQTVMTRWLFDIGSHSRTRDPGLGLVTQRSDPNDLRKHQTFLTDRGRQLAHSLARVLRLRKE